MQKQSLDSIKNSKVIQAKPRVIARKRVLPMASRAGLSDIRMVRRPQKGTPVRIHIAPTFGVSYRQKEPGPKFNPFSVLRAYATPVALALSLFLAFGGGMWYEFITPKSAAVDVAPQVAGASVSAPIPMGNVQVSDSSAAIGNDVLFNTPIEQLQDYFAAPPAPDALAVRKEQLHQFLKTWNSPLEPQADVIAEQDHWKLIMAISFAESTLGKHCYMNNCSGIGGSNIRTYKTPEDWIVDFNNLLEKRYKDKTLEQMCGVYVQPCNPHWLVATKQVLSALDQANIE